MYSSRVLSQVSWRLASKLSTASSAIFFRDEVNTSTTLHFDPEEDGRASRRKLEANLQLTWLRTREELFYIKRRESLKSYIDNCSDSELLTCPAVAGSQYRVAQGMFRLRDNSRNVGACSDEPTTAAVTLFSLFFMLYLELRWMKLIMEKKWEYKGTVHQLLIDFKKAYDSVKREVLYDILIEFGIPKKLVRLIKMCLSETYRGVRIGEWRKLHNTELHALYSSPDIIRNIKSRRLRWAGHVARMGESRNAYRVLVGRRRKRPLGRPIRWEDNIKMDLREVGYDDRDWINLAQDRDRWRTYIPSKNLGSVRWLRSLDQGCSQERPEASPEAELEGISEYNSNIRYKSGMPSLQAKNGRSAGEKLELASCYVITRNAPRSTHMH
ncbi:hypothetical protein ANN_13674 [Periplaneta americana]|uniref:Reverse transcriptase domain-containing protein n=1 Tax=Periplaneta americana TaxID=6978 RepID=A0ABQ8TMM2_PERAM|nr:hypothetical protein ANN_13674 [Periplaneta americana]